MKQIYGLFDKKAASYPWPPFTCEHVAEATRAVKYSLENKNSPVAKWPGDFCLHLLGHFDPSTGVIKSDGPQVVIEVAALQTAQQMEESQ